MKDLSGQTIRGYELLEQIGAGAYGAIYRARQPVVDREVAIKIILPEHASHPDFIRRFEVEAQLVAQLEHLHIVPLYDYWRDPEGAYLVMRLMKGGSLDRALQGGPLSLSQVIRWLEQIGAALAAAHRQGVIHRDLKPGNILLDQEGNAYLSDFGIAKDVRSQAMATLTCAITGTPAYISPEQVRGQASTPQTDIYSLGVMLFEMLTGELPFRGSSGGELIAQHLTAPLPSVREIRPDLPAELDRVIQRATAKDPAGRYPDVAALVTDVQGALSPATATRIMPSPTEIVLAAPNPYKGLRAFQEADALDFFGREALTAHLLARLALSPEEIRGEEKDRFLAVVGPSGSGKSSLVKAGLLPALRRGALPGSDRWFVVEMLPGPHPLEELEIGLLRIAAREPGGLMEQLRRDERGLVRAARLVLPSADSTLLLIIDQFEEVFTLVEDKAEARHFLDSLSAAVTAPRSPVRVILTLRADFYDRPLMYPDFSELMRRHTEVVVPLTTDELSRAIAGPAERVGAQLEPGLVTDIVADIKEQPGALPLLQYALTELYERREGRRLAKTAYRAIGGVMGALGRRAEEVYAALDQYGQALASQLFLRLVTLGEGIEDTRRRVFRSELTSLTVDKTGPSSAMEAVIEVFGKSRLLSFDRDPLTRNPTVEVAHEALLREWKRLRGWLEASRTDVRLQRLLAAAASEWVNAERDPSFLLQGTRLGQFEGWAAETKLALTQDERVFLEASLAERRAREAEEAARQRRELVAARKLAETETRRAEEQTRAAGKLRQRAVYLAGALIVAVALAFAAAWLAQRARTERNNAEHQRQVAFARELSANAVNNLSADPERSILLGLQSASTWSSVGEPVPYDLQETLHRAVAGSRAELTWSSGGDIILYVDFDPANGRPRAVAGNVQSGVMKAWDLRDSRTLLSVHGPVSRLTRVSFSPDGQYLAAPSDGRTVTLWSVASGQPWRILSGFGDDVLGAIFSPDGKSLATYSGKEQIVWEVASGKRLIELPAPPGDRVAMTFSPDGHLVAMVTAMQTAKVFEVATGRETASLSASFDVSVLALGPAPRGQAGGMRLAGAGRATIATVWDVPTARSVLTLSVAGRGGQVDFLAFSPDAMRLAVDYDLYDATTGTALFSLLGQADVPNRAAFNADGTRLISGGYYGTVRVWDLGASHELRTVVASSPALGAALSPDGKLLATGDGSRALLTDLASGHTLYTLDGHTDSVNCFAFSPDGTLLATGSADRTVMVWDVASGQAIRTLTGHQADRPGIPPLIRGAQTVLFSPVCEARRCPVASIGFDGQLIVWDARSGQALWTYQDPVGGLKSMAYGPDGRLLAVGGMGDLTIVSGTATIFDAATGEVRRTLPGPPAWLWGLAFSPDGKRLAAVYYQAGGKIWDVSTGEELLSLHSFDSGLAVAYSPDGTLLAAGGGGGKLQLWDARSGLPLFSLTGHSGLVFAVSMSADGRLLATAGSDGTTRVYTLRAEDLLTLARQRLTRSLTTEECRKYLHAETCPPER